MDKLSRIDRIVLLIAEEAAELDSGDDARDVYSVCMEVDKRIVPIIAELNKQRRKHGEG